jgi:hypothetical protein
MVDGADGARAGVGYFNSSNSAVISDCA